MPIHERHKYELTALNAMTDEDIEYSDIPPIHDRSDTVRGRLYLQVKQRITLWLDANVTVTSGKNVPRLKRLRPF